MTDGAQKLQVTNLMAGAAAGAYTLPPELLEAWKTYEGVRALTIIQPEVLGTDTAAARVVAAVASGGTPNILELGRELQRVVTDQQAHGIAQRIRDESQQQALSAAVFVAVDLADVIVSEHLRPALVDTIDKVRQLEPALAGYGADPDHDAPEKAHKAASALGRLADRRNAVFEARAKVVALVGKPPARDQYGMFVEFEHPELLTPQWNPQKGGRWPGLNGGVGPQGGAERLRWLASAEVAQAGPTVSTIDEADERWWAMFGGRVEAQNRMASDARAIGAMFPDRERPDPRIVPA